MNNKKVESIHDKNNDIEMTVKIQIDSRTVRIDGLTTYDVKIKNKECEGEIKIKSIELMKLTYMRIFLFVAISLVSFGILALLAKWYIKIRKRILYIPCNLQEATHIFITSTDDKNYIENKLVSNVQVNGSSVEIIYFVNNFLKYIYDSEDNHFYCWEFYDFAKLPYSQFSNVELKGLTDEEVAFRREMFGKCLLDIPIPTLLPYLGEVLIGPFYIIQYLSIVLWIAQEIYLYSIVLLIVTLILTILNFVFVKLSALKIKELAINNLTVKILRNMNSEMDMESIEKIDSAELVPGDIFVLEDVNTTVPCDCLLISGDALLNECMLNGESTPVTKNSIGESDLIKSQENFDFTIAKNHVLFNGTKILELKPTKHQKVLAIVLRTGFTTLKGQLVRTVIFPKNSKDEFSSQVIKFMLFYGILFLIIYVVSLVKMIEFAIPTKFLVYRFLDGILYVIPPTLNIYLSCCQTFALIRLKAKKVLGLQPNKIIPAGKIEICCFDKTGTLTKNDVDVIGYIDSVNNDTKGLLKIIDRKRLTEDLIMNSIYFKLFASCHSIHKLENELVGDSLDLQMFKFSSWNYFKGLNSNIKFYVTYNDNMARLDIIKVFEFASEYMRMSVVAYDHLTKKTFIFIKGAPEIISRICNKNTVPDNYRKMLENLSMKGYRNLGMAYKEIKDISDIDTLSREHLEEGSNFLGFLVSENKLKNDTTECISRLRAAEIDIKIISGDNPLTTIQASREANIVDKNKDVLLIDFSNNQVSSKIIKSFEQETQKSIENSNISYRNSIDIILEASVDDLDLSKKPNHLDEKSTLEFIGINHETPLAITGNLLEHLFENLNNNNESKMNLYNIVFNKCKIFSRMKPDHKSHIVECLQKSNFKVAMVGDGANDCSALKQADIGISFSVAEASFCAPFSSLDVSINCVEKVLLEGRGTLLNYIEVFRFIMSTAFIKYFANMVLSFSMAYMNDFQFFFGTFLGILPATLFLGASPPVDQLSSRKPLQSMIGLQNILSIYGQNLISAISLIVINVTLKAQSFYTFNPQLVDGDLRKSGMENTSITLAVHVIFMISNFAFVFTKPFKKRYFYNVPLTIFVAICITYNTIIIFDRSYQLAALDFIELSGEFNLTIFFIVYGFGFAMILFEELLKHLMFYFTQNKAKKTNIKIERISLNVSSN